MTIAEIIPAVTPEELLRVPDNSTMELVDGRIVEKHVSTESSKIEAIFTARFQIYLFGNPIADVFPASLGYRCFPDDPGKIRKPDTTVILLERLNKLSDPNPGYMPIVPDLAVEVISPNDTADQVDEKIQEFLDAGFPLIWLAHPRVRSVTVYSRGSRPVTYNAQDELTAEGVLPGFHCKVADFFPAPPPKMNIKNPTESPTT